MEHRRIDIDGPVHLVDFGGAGQPVLLVHGIGSSHVNFLAVADRLTDVGQVLAVDLVGYGRTPPAGRTSDLRTNRDLLVRLLRDEIGEPTVLVGTSLGGLLSLLVGGAAPDLVRALVLVGPGQPHPRGIPMNWPNALLFVALAAPGLGPLAARWMFRGDAEALARRALQRVCHDPSRVPDDLRHAHLQMTHERRAMPWTMSAFRQTARSLVRELPRTNGFEDFVRRLGPSVLLVQGAEDRLVSPRASMGLAELRPDWSFELLPDVGHSPQMEAPEQFVDRVSTWLRGIDAV